MERNSSKIGFKTKSVNNYDKKVIPDDILDKYNKINTEDKIIIVLLIILILQA